MLSDLKYAVRQFVRNLGYVAIVVLSLALGIGANTAIFSLTDDWMLKSLPVKDPGALVLFEWLPGPQGTRPKGLDGRYGDNDVDNVTKQELLRPFSRRTFDQFQREHELLADVFATAELPALTLNIDSLAETGGFGQLVSGNYYQALGVAALRGRILLPADDQPAAAPVAVISYHYWHTRFADDPAVIGKSISVNRTPVTIIGITPPSFVGTMLDAGQPTDITLPLSLSASIRSDGANLANPGTWWLDIMGRLKRGVTAEQARASLEHAFQASASGGISHPDAPPRLRVMPGGKGRTEAETRHFAMIFGPMLGMVLLVLLTACANVANLLVARGVYRQHEIAVRLALGASRLRIVRQLLTESMTLAVLGAGLGLLFSKWGLALLAGVVPPADKGVFDHVTLDPRVLAFTTAVALLTGLLFGLGPALQATRFNLNAQFQGSTRNLGSGTRSLLGKSLIVIQVTLSLVLLVAAGLFARTLHNLRAVDIGFNRTNLLLFSINASAAGYKTTQFANLHEGIAAQIGRMPGVRAVTYSGWPFISGYGGEAGDFSVLGSMVPPAKGDRVTWNQVGANFFETYEMPLVLGHGFAANDDGSTRQIAVINQALAKKYFVGEDPIGRFISLQGKRQIIGVVCDVKQADLRAVTPATAFIPFSQNVRGEAHFAVRTTADPEAMIASLRKAVSDVERNLPLIDVRTEDEQVEWRLETAKIFASLSAFLGLLALVLACVGLYGLISYAVLRRTGEIGLRMALGALPTRMLWMVLSESLMLVGVGVVFGLAAAGGASGLISHMLYGLSPIDPATYAGVALLLIFVAALACLLPARRAAKVDPMTALRAE